MNYIYLDNASTSYPKAPTVGPAMEKFINTSSININRGSYAPAYDVEEIVFSTRQTLCKMMNGYDEQYVTFTQNVTMSLNMALQGLLKAGDHVLISSMEHNAVLRPLTYLTGKGISYDIIPCTADGSIQIDSIPQFIKPSTAAIIINHASNVCGTVQDISTIGSICKNHDLLFIVDSAQTAGILPIDMKASYIDALCFTGHKGLMGPQGIGGIILSPTAATSIEPLIYGGTGSYSDVLTMPLIFPDRLEPGTLNLPGIMGLHESLRYIQDVGIDAIRQKELDLTKQFLQGIKNMPTLRIVGKENLDNRVAVVSVTCEEKDNAHIAYQLESEYNILTRVGLHCAPLAHQTLGTYPTGTIRFSFGYGNTINDIDTAVMALHQLIK